MELIWEYRRKDVITLSGGLSELRGFGGRREGSLIRKILSLDEFNEGTNGGRFLSRSRWYFTG